MNGFNAWKVGLPYYGPLFILGTAFLFFNLSIAALILVVALAILGFFRDPPRTPSSDPRDIVSPADGTIAAIEELEDSDHYDGPCMRVSIFLSVFNVHVNRTPYDAEVVNVRYQRGKYTNAMKPLSSKVNESNALWLKSDFGAMTVRQISGAVARRIVCLPKPGQALQKGDKFGMIRFGSRTELYLPMNTHVCVKMKDKVKGARTVIAQLPPPSEDSH